MKRTVIAMGLPKTGKTTFLATLWDVVRSGEVVGSLQMERTYGDMEYLNKIRDEWADCKPISRTGPASDRPVSMLLRDSAGTVTELAWTDMLGESFERQWTERVWANAYQQLADDAVGVLLFLHPRKVQDSPLIVDAQRAMRQLRSGEDTGPAVAGKQAEAKMPSWDVATAPTQVQLVDLLQFLQGRRPRGAGMRIAVIVSAWDLVQKTMKITPEAWFKQILPLLDQFLTANREFFQPRVFGVSAQGGDYSDAAALQKTYMRASDRISVVSGGAPSHDITAPVRWAIGSPSI